MASTINDDRLIAVQDKEKAAIDANNKLYQDMIDGSDSYYQKLKDNNTAWKDEQTRIQNEQTDFAIKKIEQQKEQTAKDYTREQSGAYVDWQKESNRYGANAEEMAAGGLINAGYGESSQVRMYNTYQNRVATARQSYELAKQNYDNAITEARLQNNSALAEIAYKAMQQELELALQGFQYKNDLIREQSTKAQQISDTYHARYQDVLAQINRENAEAEQKRQFEAQQKQQREIQEAQLREQQRQFDILHPENNSYDFGNGSGGSGGSSAENYNFSGGGTVTNPLNSPLTDKKREELLKSVLGTKQAATQEREKTATQSGRTHSGGSSRISNEVKTDYYQGAKNSDANRYGTFSNGYQPKGISGYGAVSKTGDTVTFTTQTMNGKTVKVKQNVWQTVDGTKWYWDGRYNKYIKTK
jgi:hypothetical protein